MILFNSSSVNGFFHVRILTSFGAGDLGTEVDFIYAMMWVTKITF